MFGHGIKTVWAATRYFILGLAAALLLAPQNGAESRRLLRDRIMNLFDQAVPTNEPHHADHAEGAGGAAMDKQEYWETAAPDNTPWLQ